jgi:folate-binding protein YgfZ
MSKEDRTLHCDYALLDSEALLHIVGPDSLKFLQGQTTCDTRTVDAEHATPGAFCTPQGRVVCDFLLCELAPEHFALRMRRDIRENAAAAFGKYIIFSKAKLDAASNDWLAVGLWGEQAAEAATEIFGGSPQARFGAYRTDDCVIIQLDEHGQLFECFLQKESSQRYLTRMDTLINQRSETQWQVQQIINGFARIEAPTMGEFVPQSLNYDHTGHISFKKGCYTGQEVVARLHYLGKAKRRAYAAQLLTATDCAPGAPLHSADTGQSVGNVINSSTADDTTFLLVTATVAGVDNGLLLGATDGPLLTVLTLPYSVENA